MSEFSFDELSRQSPKGIVINYGVLLYKLVKSFWVLIPIFFSNNIGNKLGSILMILGSPYLIYWPLQSRLMPLLDEPLKCALEPALLELGGLLDELDVLLVVGVDGIFISGSSL